MQGQADLNRSFFALSARIRREFGRRMADEAWAHEKGLRPGCFSVLRVVDEAGGGLSQREVSEQVGIDPSDVVGLIDVLEAAGFVQRERDAADRRRYSLSTTADGRKALRRFAEVSADVDAAVYGILSEPEREQLAALLGRIIESEPAGAPRP